MHTTIQLARLAFLVFILSIIAAASSTSPASAAPRVSGDEKWLPGPTLGGINGKVNATAVDGDGKLYIGGEFTAVGNLPVRHIAMWNGSAWSALGNGLSDVVESLVWDIANKWLYAGGDFADICSNSDCTSRTSANFIARWDSADGNWYPLGLGVSGPVAALTIGNAGRLYAGGYFAKICSDAACSAPGTTANNIAMWDPTGGGTWSVLSDGVKTGVTGYVRALAWWVTPVQSFLIVGGWLTEAGKWTVNNIAVWTPGNWSRFGNGVDGGVLALAVDPVQKAIAVGGIFTNICQTGEPPACGTPKRANNLAVVKGGSWDPVKFGVTSSEDGGVMTLAVDTASQNLYVGGQITGYCTDLACLAPTPVAHVARFNYGSQEWSSLGSGIDGYVNALAWNGTSNLLYAGGKFSKAGDVATASLTTWDGSAWSGFGAGNGANPFVWTIAADRGGRVYVGGSFKTAGNLTVNNIALWDSTAGTWSALDNGLAGYPHALLVGLDGSLYAAGFIWGICSDLDCRTGLTRVNNVVKWTPNGTSGTWSSVGYGLNGSVYSLALDRNGNLYAGAWYGQGICGDAACFPPTASANVTKWDGKAWSSLGSSLKGGVPALAVDRNNNLYAGGDFTHVCVDLACNTTGAQVNHVVRRSASGGGDWQPLDNGLDGSVNSIIVDTGDNVYVGGAFTHTCNGSDCATNTLDANGVAKWNAGWSAVGSGVRGEVTAMAVDDRSNLYVLGAFQNLCADGPCTSAGALVNHIARWDGSNWSGVGSGLGPSVATQIVGVSYRDAFLTVGGHFATAGDKVSANVARYNTGAFLFFPLVKR